MPTETLPFDAAKYLTAPEDQAELLNDALATGHAGYIANAIGIIARTRGMTEIANATGLQRQALYRALGPGGNPTLETLVKVLNALGVKLAVAA